MSPCIPFQTLSTKSTILFYLYPGSLAVFFFIQGKSGGKGEGGLLSKGESTRYVDFEEMYVWKGSGKGRFR